MSLNLYIELNVDIVCRIRQTKCVNKKIEKKRNRFDADEKNRALIAPFHQDYERIDEFERQREYSSISSSSNESQYLNDDLNLQHVPNEDVEGDTEEKSDENEDCYKQFERSPVYLSKEERTAAKNLEAKTLEEKTYVTHSDISTDKISINDVINLCGNIRQHRLDKSVILVSNFFKKSQSNELNVKVIQSYMNYCNDPNIVPWGTFDWQEFTNKDSKECLKYLVDQAIDKYKKQILENKYEKENNFKSIEDITDNFTAVNELKYGSMSTVILTLNKKPDNHVPTILNALKIEKKYKNYEMRKSILNGLLEHPNILRLYNWFEDGDFIFQFYEFAPYGNLEQILDHDIKRFFKDKKDLRIMKVIQFYSAQLLMAINFLHKSKVGHFGIIPKKIYIGHRGYLKLNGFKKITLEDEVDENGEFKTRSPKNSSDLDEEKKHKFNYNTDLFGFAGVLRAFKNHWYVPNKTKIKNTEESLIIGNFKLFYESFNETYTMPPLRALHNLRFFKEINFLKLFRQSYNLENELNFDYETLYEIVNEKRELNNDETFSINSVFDHLKQCTDHRD